MKKTVLIAGFLAITLTGCEKEEDVTRDFKIEGLTVENFPKIDGSTSNQPLMRIIVCKLLGYEYEWEAPADIYTVISIDHISELNQLAPVSQTHGAIINLIDKKTDLIFSARKMSDDEKEYSRSKSVSLIETPIALDALIMLVNPKNPVNSLTVSQIQDIYRWTVTDWRQVGGNNSPVQPYIRNQNSGSQELFEDLVMDGQTLTDFPYDYEGEVTGMFPVFNAIRNDENSICYTVSYYKERMIVESIRNAVKTLAVNGVTPGRETFKNGTYPFVAPVYASIRNDLDISSMAYKLYEWLQTAAGKSVITESGYVPY